MAKTKKTEPDTQEQPDPLSQALGPSDIEKFVEEHKVKLILGFLAIVTAIVVFFVSIGAREKAQTEAAQKYSKADTVDDYAVVESEFAGTVPGGNALIRQADLLEEEGKLDDAVKKLRKFLDDYGDHPRKDQVLIALGRIAQDRGELDDARAYYDQVASASPLYDLARINLGDLLILGGDYVEANAIYQDILLKKRTDSREFFGDLQMRLDLVERQLALTGEGDSGETDAGETEQPPVTESGSSPEKDAESKTEPGSDSVPEATENAETPSES